MKKVSVIVPAYNCAEYISKCLDALLSQTYPNIEIIVINDGSPDNLAEILDGYGDRIHVITKMHGGASSARNMGIDAATGDYISFVDADDWIDGDVIEKAVRLMEETNSDIARFNIVSEYDSGEVKHHFKFADEQVIMDKANYREEVYIPMMEGVSFISPTGMYTREVIGDVRFDERMSSCEDGVFNLFVFTKSSRIIYDPSLVYHYYQNSEGLTRKRNHVIIKYTSNYKFGRYMTALLPEWGMDTLYYRLKVLARLVRITITKLKRIR